MPLKADWHIGENGNGNGATATVDPFTSSSSPDMTLGFRPGGAPIRLDTPEAELHDRLDSLLAYEARLDARGITCGIKDLPDSSCLACPVSKADDDTAPLCPLCRVGVTEELVVTTLLAKRVAGVNGSAAA